MSSRELLPLCPPRVHAGALRPHPLWHAERPCGLRERQRRHLARHTTRPLIAPGIAAAAVITFLAAWASFLIPLTFAPTSRAQPITVLITQFVTRYSQNYSLQAAAGILALIPPLLVVVWLNRYLLAGLLRGAGK